MSRLRIVAAAFVLALAPAAALAQTPAPAAPAAKAPAAAAAPAEAAPAAPAAAPKAVTIRQGLGESVAAVVNDDVISTYDLRQRMRLLAFSSGIQLNEQNAAEVGREALRGLVDERLEADEIAHTESRQGGKFKFYPTNREIDEEIGGLAKQFGATPEALTKSLAAVGVEPQTLRNQVGAQGAWRRYIQARYQDSVHIGDEQITSVLERIAASAGKPQYLVSEIFLDAARSGGQAQAEEGGRQLVEQIRGGAPFAAVARQFSALPTAANGGDAGWLVSGQMQPELEKVLAALRPGQTADPIPVQDGVYVLQLRDRRAGAAAILVNLKQAAVRLPADATPAQVADAEAKLAALREAAGACRNMETEAAKMQGVVAGDLGEASIDELSPEFRKVVDGLKSGEMGGPVRTSVGLQLIGVCARRTGGAQAPTRTDIENRIYAEQLDMLGRRFLRDLRNSAAVDTR